MSLRLGNNQFIYLRIKCIISEYVTSQRRLIHDYDMVMEKKFCAFYHVSLAPSTGSLTPICVVLGYIQHTLSWLTVIHFSKNEKKINLKK